MCIQIGMGDVDVDVELKAGFEAELFFILLKMN